MRRYDGDVDGVDRNVRFLFWFGIGFMIVGVSLLAGAFSQYLYSLSRVDERIYVTATITYIEEIETGDSENPIDHKIYLYYVTPEGSVRGELNEYRSKYKEGDKIEIYYYGDEIDYAYHIDSDRIILLFMLMPIAFAGFGALLVFSKKVREVLADLAAQDDGFVT